MGWKINDFNPIWVRLLGRSQLSNPSDLPCSRSRKANLRDLIAATGLVIFLKFYSNHQFFGLCDLEIWCMTLKNNGAPLLYNIKLCASFQSHRWIQTELQSRNAQIRVKICDFFPVWPLKLMDDFEKQQGTSSMKFPWPSGQFTGLPHGRSWFCPWCPARGVIPHGCSPYHTSMAVGKGLGRLVHISSRCWEATCGWG